MGLISEWESLYFNMYFLCNAILMDLTFPTNTGWNLNLLANTMVIKGNELF